MKKITKITIIILPILILVLFSIIFYGQNYLIKKNLKNYWFSEKSKKGKTIKNYEVVRCNYNIFNPEVAFISDHLLLKKYPELKIYFYKPSNYFLGVFKKGYIGTTGVKNTTFSQLLKMVKEDCYQFQINGKKDNMSWVYMEYNYEEEQREKKEREEERKRIMEEIKNRKPLTKEEIEEKRKENERLQKEQEKLDKELEEKMRNGEIDLE